MVKESVWERLGLLVAPVLAALLALLPQTGRGDDQAARAKTLVVEGLDATTAHTLAEQAIHDAAAGGAIDESFGVVGEKWALLVGVNKYAHPKSGGYLISDLRCPENDVRSLRDFLADPGRGMFDPAKVLTLTGVDATLIGVHSALADIAKRVGPEDLVLVYFSGHGFQPSEDSPAYLLPVDADLSVPEVSCIQWHTLAARLNQLRANKIITIIDACHAGGVSPEGKAIAQPSPEYRAAFEEAEGRAMLMSSDTTEKSWEMAEGQNSVFTHFLLRGLAGEADHDGNKVIGFTEVAAYLEREVPSYTREHHNEVQRPIHEAKARGDIPLAVMVTAIQEGKLRDALAAYRSDLSRLSRFVPESMEGDEFASILTFALGRKEQELRGVEVGDNDKAALELIEQLAAGSVDEGRYRVLMRGLYPPDGVPRPPEPAAEEQGGVGTIVVNTRPMGARVYVDGEFLGNTPKVLADIRAGKRKVKVESPGRPAFEQEIVVPAGDRVKFTHTW